MNKQLMSSTICLVISGISWFILAFVALMLPGGHPPLVAYLAVPIMVILVLSSSAGIALAFFGAKSPKVSSHQFSWLLTGHATALALVAAALSWQLI
ncbi:hypothetical protein G4Y73_00180 [Wenzhouxiangella sp. XN201]|uniref:hypothetical protein n=1 Tax=Wenzhouxiangella sp. XN201 TaxID=2710755 RepID=UPI0013C5A3D9|nr:hypothetical protein [Wenzhouxiangella sp. XN201]NEZ02560.1 hypothetical protein [Wenzhouxiangella sp. XN201]